MKTHLTKVSLALMAAAFLLGCQDQGSEPVGPEGVGPQFAEGGGPQFAREKNCDPDKGDIHPSCKDGDDGNADTFDVTISTVGGDDWTDGAQKVQSNNAKNWLHIFDSGGNGTRGRPNYANAAFSTKILLKPPTATGCVNQDGSPMTDATNTLFKNLDQTSKPVVFDFQVDYDIVDNPGDEGAFFFFLFRWQDGSRTFSAEIGPFPASSDRGIAAFSGDGPIDDPTATRVFELTGGSVIAKELDKNKVIRTVACPNPEGHTIVLTVAPLGTL